MLTLENVTSAIGGAKYYCQTTCSYSLDSNKTSQFKKWYGVGAETLELSGNIKYQDFQKILEGKINYQGQNIVLGTKKQGEIIHSPGRDLTFAAPKSVSLQHNLEGGDKRIKNALIKAAENTLEYVEKNFIYTRVKDKGKIILEKTNNITAGLFYENLNRDKEFHDHIHCVVANMTQKKDGVWRSIELRRVFDNQLHIGKVFRMELAFNLKHLGYDLEVTDKSNYFFEIKDFDQKLSEHFSDRTTNILQKAKQLNRNLNAKVRQLANFLTRNPNKQISPQDLKLLTENKIENYKKETGNDNIIEKIYKRTNTAKNRIISTSTVSATRNSLGYAIKHLSERNTVFSQQQIIEIAKNDSLGSINLESIEKEISYLLKKQFLITGYGKYQSGQDITFYATRHSLEREKAIISIMQEGKGIFKPVTSLNKAQILLNDLSLNNGQKEAVKLILTSKDRIFGIQGFAGTGKTYMLSKLKETLEKINENNQSISHKIIGLAPSGTAVKELQSVLGQNNARTLQGFLAQYDGYASGRGTKEGKEKIQEEFKNTILIVDEASMISSTQMKDLLTIGKILNVKIVPIGDSRQLLSVEAGNPFYELQREGMKTAMMTQNIRQKTDIDKAISYSAYDRDFIKLFEKVGSNLLDCTELSEIENKDNHKKSQIISNEDTAFNAARLYMSFNQEKRKDTLILAQSNKTKNLINQFIRQILVDKNLLGAEHSKIQTLINKNLTLAERSRDSNYKINDVILFNKANPKLNILKNEYFQIQKREGETLVLKSLNNQKKSIEFIPLKSQTYAKYAEVYKVKERELRQSDQIMFTRKIDSKIFPIVNSTLATVKEIKKDSYILSIEDKEFQFAKDSMELKHIDYSYCRTTHKGQGKTTKTSILVTESWWKHLTNQRNILVQATRHKDEIFMVVDNKAAVIERIVENRGDREGAIEFIENNQNSLIKKKQLSESLFKILETHDEYARYKIALEDSKNFNLKIKDRVSNPREIENKIDSKLKISENLNISPSALDRVLNLEDKTIDKLKNQIADNEVNENNIDTQSNNKSRRTHIITTFSDHEIKNKWEEAIKQNFPNTNLKNISQAIEKAFANNGTKVRFGEKNSCELTWYGKAGYVRDYKSDNELKWGEGNIKLTPEEKERFSYKVISQSDLESLKEEALNKKKEMELSNKLAKSEAAKKATKIFNSISNNNINKDNPYLLKKNISNIASLNGIKFTKDNRLVIPIRNAQNTICSLQYINKDGAKFFLKNGEKKGNFFLIEDSQTKPNQTIFLAEGFATAASIHLATKNPVAVCFDSGNIDQTLKNLKEKFPNNNFVIAGDDDKYTYINSKQVNSGKDKAISAAIKHNVGVIFPTFNNNNITQFKQINNDSKGPTDFNDLHKLEGIKSVKAQLLDENNFHNLKENNINIQNHPSHYTNQLQN